MGNRLEATHTPVRICTSSQNAVCVEKLRKWWARRSLNKTKHCSYSLIALIYSHMQNTACDALAHNSICSLAGGWRIRVPRFIFVFHVTHSCGEKQVFFLRLVIWQRGTRWRTNRKLNSEKQTMRFIWSEVKVTFSLPPRFKNKNIHWLTVLMLHPNSKKQFNSVAGV